jgi:hypothetical protein
MKFSKIAIAAALSIASVGAFAQAFDLGSEVGTVIESTTDNAVNAPAVTVNPVCAFTPNAGFALAAPTTRRIGAATLATSAGGRIGNLQVSGFDRYTIAPVVTLTGFTGFSGSTVSPLVSLGQTAVGATTAPAGTTFRAGVGAEAQAFTMTADTVSVWVPSAMAHATAGFSRVGTMAVNTTLTCVNAI